MRSPFEIFGVYIIIDGASFYISVIARASGSEAELCLYTVNDDDDDTISNDAALHCYFLKIWFENGDLALNCGFQPPYRVEYIGKNIDIWS